jgi:hypothetical protein
MKGRGKTISKIPSAEKPEIPIFALPNEIPL